MKIKKETVECIRRFNRFYTVLMGTLDSSFMGSGFSVAETRVLFELSSEKSGSATLIAEKLRIDKSYMSRIVRRLEKSGLAVQAVSKQDRRARVIALTPEGKAQVRALVRMADEQICGLISGLSESECRKICKAMELISGCLAQ